VVGGEGGESMRVLEKGGKVWRAVNAYIGFKRGLQNNNILCKTDLVKSIYVRIISTGRPSVAVRERQRPTSLLYSRTATRDGTSII